MKKWTSSELEVLLASDGKPIPIIEGRSPESIRQKMMRMGLKSLLKVPGWTEEEIVVLKSAQGELPSVSGRSPGAVRNKLIELGLGRGRTDEWKPEEIEILRSFSGSGLPCVQGRSAAAVRTKMKEMLLIKPKFKKWSKREIFELRRLFGTGEKIEISGRTESAVQKKIHELGLTKGLPKSGWDEAEIENIKRLGTTPGRSKNAIQSMKVRLGITNKYNPRKKWSRENEVKLRELHSEGMSANKIHGSGFFPGQTKMAIQKKLCRMGLAKKLDVKISRFPQDIAVKFDKFLMDNWKGNIPEDIAEKWNVENPRHPVNKAKVAKNLLRLGIKISCYEVQRISNLKRKESEMMASNTANPSSLMEKIRAERVRLMRSRIERNKDIWTGLDTEERVEELDAV